MLVNWAFISYVVCNAQILRRCHRRNRDVAHLVPGPGGSRLHWEHVEPWTGWLVVEDPNHVLLDKPHGIMEGDTGRSVQPNQASEPWLLSMGWSQTGFVPGLHIQNALQVPFLLTWLRALGHGRNVVDKPWLLETEEAAPHRRLLERQRLNWGSRVTPPCQEVKGG